MDTLISSLLERLLATSVQTALLTVAVWVLCRYLPRLSPASQCWLWWLVALQAILGLVANPVELAWLPRASAAAPEILATTQSNVAVLDSAAAPPVTTQAWMSWQSMVILLWATGSLLMAWFTLRDWLHSKALLTSSSSCNDEHLLQALERTAATCGLRAAPELRLSPDIESPVLIGHLRPTLLLPASTLLSDEELDMALIHELSHLCRNDLWWGFIPALARHLFFFHPFAHLAVREYGIARETACDAAVVNSTHLCRQNYGRLLLRLGASPESRAGLAVSSPTFHCLKQRLAMLQNTSFLPRTASIVVMAIIAVGVTPLRLVAAADAPATINAPATALQNDVRREAREIQDSPEQQTAQQASPLREAERKRPQPDKMKVEAIRGMDNTDKPNDQPTLDRTAIRAAFAMDPVIDDRVNPDGTYVDPATFGKLICRVTRDGSPALDSALQQLAKGCRPLNVFQADENADRANRIAELEKRLVELQIVFTDKHPEVISLHAQLRALQLNTPAQVPDTLDVYRLGRGDILQISVLQHPDLGTELPVRPDGRISTPFVENVIAVGKTPSQLARDIESALKQFIKAPRVSVIVKSIGRQ